MISRPEFNAMLSNLMTPVIPSKSMWKSSEDFSFSEKNMSDKTGISSLKPNPFTESGEHSTLAMLKDLYSCENVEMDTETPCGGGQVKDSDVPKIPIETQDSDWWKFPSAQPLSLTLTRKVESQTVQMSLVVILQLFFWWKTPKQGTESNSWSTFKS